jgi:small subunit ribosomal protein S6
MAFYESTFITRQEISEADVTKLTEEFSAVVKKEGGKVVKSEYWGLRSLAYPINKSKKGHYVHFGIEGNGQLAIALEKKFVANEDIVRNLIIKVDELDETPSAPLNKNEDSGDESYKKNNKRY